MITEPNNNYAVVIKYSAYETSIYWFHTLEDAFTYYRESMDTDKWILKHIPISVQDSGD